MDNMLKLVLGVLAISGIIAFLVPSESPVAPPVEATPAAAAAPAPATEEYDEGDAEGSDSADDELDDDESDDGADEEDFRLGEPSIDGQPFGGAYAPPVDPSTSATASNNTNESPPVDSVPINNNGNVVL
jgi:hypothetical protein